MSATSGSFRLPRGRPFTVHDLAAAPDDGNRYELIDGTVLVSPVPGTSHQVAVVELAVVLDRACPAAIRVLTAPYAVRPNESTEVQPDVLVARREDLTDANLPVAPLLAVEVLSPSSVVTDFNYKKAVYERMGTPSYWVVDPRRPSLTVFERDRATGRYGLVAEVTGGEPFEAAQPFPVRVVPGDLVDDATRA